MRSLGVKLLNNKLSEYVRLAASGETVLVTDRDRVVAVALASYDDRMLEAAQSLGIAIWPPCARVAGPRSPPPAAPKKKRK